MIFLFLFLPVLRADHGVDNVSMVLIMFLFIFHDGYDGVIMILIMLGFFFMTVVMTGARGSGRSCLAGDE